MLQTEPSSLSARVTIPKPDPLGCGFVAGEQQQEQHRHHLVAADASPFLFDADKLSDQSFAAGLTRSLQTLLHVAFHGEDLRNDGEEAKGARETREAACPGRKLRPVGERQPKKLA